MSEKRILYIKALWCWILISFRKWLTLDQWVFFHQNKVKSATEQHLTCTNKQFRNKVIFSANSCQHSQGWRFIFCRGADISHDPVLPPTWRGTQTSSGLYENTRPGLSSAITTGHTRPLEYLIRDQCEDRRKIRVRYTLDFEDLTPKKEKKKSKPLTDHFILITCWNDGILGTRGWVKYTKIICTNLYFLPFKW